MVLLPREHGAYGQLAFPLLTALFVTGATPAALWCVLAIVTAFLLHEPALILLGHRGGRTRRELGPRAQLAVMALGSLVLGSGSLSMMLAPPHTRWAFAVPAVPALVVVFTIVTNREKSTGGELAVAVALSLAAVPVAVCAGATPETAVTIAAVFTVLFAASVLAVRSVVLGVRSGGNPRAVAASRAAIRAGSVVAVGALWSLGGQPSRWIPVAAVAPALLFALAVTVAPPSPTRLRALGWSIVAASTFASAVLVAGL